MAFRAVHSISTFLAIHFLCSQNTQKHSREKCHPDYSVIFLDRKILVTVTTVESTNLLLLYSLYHIFCITHVKEKLYNKFWKTWHVFQLLKRLATLHISVCRYLWFKLSKSIWLQFVSLISSICHRNATLIIKEQKKQILRPPSLLKKSWIMAFETVLPTLYFIRKVIILL